MVEVNDEFFKRDVEEIVIDLDEMIQSEKDAMATFNSIGSNECLALGTYYRVFKDHLSKMVTTPFDRAYLEPEELEKADAIKAKYFQLE